MCQPTFSGLVSTLKRIRPKQRMKTIPKDEHNTKMGFLATQVPYFLNIKYKRNQNSSRKIWCKYCNSMIDMWRWPVKVWHVSLHYRKLHAISNMVRIFKHLIKNSVKLSLWWALEHTNSNRKVTLLRTSHQ